MAGFPEAIARLADALFPGSRVERLDPLRPDAGGEAADEAKAIGYGEPVQVTLRLPGGEVRRVVFRTQVPNEFGHDRRSDRMDEALVAWDLFNRTPDHVRALDVGVIAGDGRLVSLRGTGEPYLVTEWAEGVPYAEDLRRVARAGAAGALDLARAGALARWLAALHRERGDDPPAWRRAVRDLLGHGEGIFGMIDGYPPDTPAAPPERLRAMEERCLAWRWRLRDRPGRLARTHGDFHPFNILFAGDGTAPTLLDAARGGRGDPADDLTALSVNYVFFAAEHRDAWPAGLGPLWRGFWTRWLEATGDRAALETAPPFLAWRALVVASPRFYPGLGAPARDLLLRLAEEALDAGGLDLDLPGRLLGAPRRGAVVWATGLPASGKSTFARRLCDRLAAAHRPALLLDGDALRATVAPEVGHAPAAREAFYATLGDLALCAAAEGAVAVVAATAHRREFRDRVRARAPAFVEVLVDASVEACAARDPKGLYALARAGRAPDLPGVGVPYERPPSPEVVAAGGEDAAALAAALAALGER